MPKSVCHGWAAIHPASVRQLATRPESTPSVAVNRNSVEPERRSQYISANAGKIFQVTKAPPSTEMPSTGRMRANRTRLRCSQSSVSAATIRLISDPREYESTSAAKKTAPPAARPFRETGESDAGV